MRTMRRARGLGDPASDAQAAAINAAQAQVSALTASLGQAQASGDPAAVASVAQALSAAQVVLASLQGAPASSGILATLQAPITLPILGPVPTWGVGLGALALAWGAKKFWRYGKKGKKR